ncbi:AAA domain-containing protein [Clostridium aestuarii]|uniref:AAA domain-containing protein n=1 Tax=Clostridium aestuarii TaxID=338193 RepID=A0ABT4D1K7_9CLOT|nr:AAA domain-containing protein [Clostridium aestuarii]MCY6484992.1 AAA domain-containing protein [Clostridium aestuarii]
MCTRDKLQEVAAYLISVKNLNKKSIRHVSEYQKIFWEKELNDEGYTIKGKIDDDWWIEIDKNNKLVYDDFFKLYLKLQKRSDNLEIVWGQGFLAWSIHNKKIAHPLFTIRMELEFDAKNAKFILKPCSNNINLEIDILEGLDIPNLDKIIKIKNHISLKNFKELEDILNSIIHYLSPNINPSGEIQKNRVILKDIKITKYPVVYNASSIIVRKNDNRIWDTELKNMMCKINEGCFIPDAIKALVNDKKPIQNSKTIEEWENISKELLFPLPYNKEQSKIVKSLSANFGVVVQGPPGTGKSHTIVNLICHLLAHGKRVLVTSETGKALRVLADKIPDEIRPLCINMIGNDMNALKELDYSIKKLTDNLNCNVENVKKESDKLENELKESRKKQKDLYNKLKISEEIENGDINYYGKKYKLLNIAKWVKENEDQYSWIDDDVEPKQKCPITDAKFSRLIYLLSNIRKKEIIEFKKVENLLYNIPSCDEIVDKIARLSELKSNYKYYKSMLKEWCVSYNVDYDYEHIFRLLENAEKFLVEIEGTWFENILKPSKKSETVRIVLKNILMRCNFYIKKICSIKKEINGHEVEIPKDIDIVMLAQNFDIVYKQYEHKGKVSKLFKVIHSDYKNIIEECKVDCKPITNKEQAKIVKKYIEQCYVEKNLKNLWNRAMKEYEAPKIKEVNLAIIAQLEDEMNKIDIIINWDKAIKNRIIVAMRNIAFLSDINWYDIETYQYLRNGFLSIKYINEYENINTYMLSLQKVISNMEGFEEIVQAIRLNSAVSLKIAYKKVDKFKQMTPKIKEIALLISKVNKECPLLAKNIIEDEDRLNMLNKYKNLSMAWRWKQLECILRKAHKYEFDDLENDIEKEKARENSLVCKIVYKKAWYNQIKRIGETERRSLYAWLDAVKRIGKGTGKHSVMFRKLAQREMEKCKDIIPAWIMPINKVIENFSLSSDMFDVVIIDESSQCNIFGISALLRAKKAVIVGDDKQINPEAVGINMDKIQYLIDRYLKDIPHSEWFDMQTSLYNTALRVFPDRIMLKEHFRCVPEIIEFSNRLCYSNEIMPLRRFNSNEKLGLPIKTVKVDGKRDKTKPINIKEAEALVQKVVECCKNPKYKGMSMGVISLLGDVQSEIIENMLREKIGDEEMIERKIICGNSYSFQGAEREIMFLSMVIAPNVNFIALTKENDIRRFNVAASRARNQMWVFHSVNLQDLNPKCVRTQFLEYCINSNKMSSKKIDLKNIFQSQLQKDVYRMLKEKDYEVKPQVVIGKHKIDFVIEGYNKKIAIECDGDKTEKIERWEEEYDKQICLHRVGWKFLRIKGSEFYRNPEETINKLCKRIESEDIDKGIA